MEFTYQNLHFSENDPEMPYREEERTVIAQKKPVIGVGWGQRKLAIAELYFLTRYCETQRNLHLLYIGAAPGTHINFLTRIFPTITFHLYDPRKFFIEPSPNIILYPQYFTKDHAEQWRNAQNLIFISDIRRDFREDMPRNEHEQIVIEDMQKQWEFLRIIRPKISFLKFRPPFFEGEMQREYLEYPEGIIFKQPWAPIISNETRLVVSQKDVDSIKKYHIKSYRDKLFYHNVYVRNEVKFLNPFTKKTEPIWYPELLDDFNSLGETLILSETLKKINYSVNLENVRKLSRTLTIILNEKKQYKNWVTISRLRENPFLITEKYETHDKK